VSASAAGPLRGGCGCGAVSFEIRAHLLAAWYCHCHRCQHRTGTSCSPAARLARADLELHGRDSIRAWQPEGGMPKAFCATCGNHLFAGSLDSDFVAIRLGAIDGDPGIRPEYRQWVSSAAPWEPIPDDGLPRYDAAAP
jgi:hypothetical protein